jgi:pimeloyl-ACP methyl ester carboxylesterase
MLCRWPCVSLATGRRCFAHGSFGWGLDTFPDQRELADSFRIVLVDRGGYNAAPAGAVVGWPADASDLVAALEDYGGAHLIGQSYGAVTVLVAAGRRPDLIRSLVVIEPPLYGIAADTSAVRPILAALEQVIEAAPSMTAESFAYSYATTVMSLSLAEAGAWIGSWGPTDRAAADSTRREICAADASVDLNALAATRVRKTVVIGGWGQTQSPGASDAGVAFRVTGERLSAAIGTRHGRVRTLGA